MWKLTIVDDEGKRTELPLSRGEYAIGRAEENTVRLTDRNISRKHMVLRRTEEEGWIVEDNGSYNGCFVNGIRVAGTHPLHHGDLLQLGDYRLEVHDESKLAGDTSAESTSDVQAAAAASLLDRPDRLVVVDGAASGTEFPLEGERIIIGRAEDADISINHSSVSRVHAEIVNLGAGVYEMIDRGSSNGVRVNGIKLERRVIEDDDEIELGDVRLRFVARGRIFRPGALVGAGSPYGAASSSARYPAQRKGGLGVMVAAGAILGIVAVIGFVALYAGDDSSATGASAERTVLDQSVLEEAKRLSEAGDHEGAHAKLAALPEGSPLRDSAIVREIEGKWADEAFARAATASDLSQRRAILEEIAAAKMVDAERRSRAANMRNAMDGDATAPDSLPLVASGDRDGGKAGPASTVLAPNPFEPGSGTPSAPDTARTSGTAKGTAAAPPKSTAPPPKPTTTAKGPDDAREAILNKDDGEARARRMLEPRVWSGRATVDEIKMLRAICRHQRDSACVARCTAMLREKQ